MVKFSFKFLLGEYCLHSCAQGKREMYRFSSRYSQISFYYEYEFYHLLHEWLYNITILYYYDHQLLYNSYSTCNNQGVKCLKEPGTSGKTIQMEWKAITKT